MEIRRMIDVCRKDEVQMATSVEILNSSILNQLARTVADMVTHPRVSKVLAECCIAEDGGNPKWERLERAWSQQQSKDGCGNAVIRCVQLIMQPVEFVNRQGDFHRYRDSVNRILAFAGISIGDDGVPRRVTVARNIDEAQRRVDSLRSKLDQRSIHPDVYRFCKAELLKDNYFHATLEASKSVAEKLRNKSGLTSDGAEIVDSALSGSAPLLAINTLQTETERSEQRGFANLLKGIFGTFRNVTAHAPKVCWAINELDALDMLSTLSYVHRRLDAAVRTR
jgi:uncharacterized protein (TIGR02391 family)